LAIDAGFVGSTLAAAITMATPLLVAGIGELIAERTGVLNLGCEGMMLMGGIGGFIMEYYTRSPELGLAAGVIVGVLMGLVMAFLCVTARVNQPLAGLGIWILGLGLSYFIFRAIWGMQLPYISTLRTIRVPFLAEIPWVGPILFEQNLVVYFAFFLVLITSFILSRTSLGLRMRAVGENPLVAETLGVNPTRIRSLAVLIAGALAGLAGAYYSTAMVGTFTYDLIAGRGFIAIALVYFGKWNPYRTALAALLFAGIDAAQLRLQAIGMNVPYQFLLMTPYIFTIVMMALVSRKAEFPASLGVPYKKGK